MENLINYALRSFTLRCESLLDRIPPQIRTMSMKSFIATYGANGLQKCLRMEEGGMGERRRTVMQAVREVRRTTQAAAKRYLMSLAVQTNGVGCTMRCLQSQKQNVGQREAEICDGVHDRDRIQTTRAFIPPENHSLILSVHCYQRHRTLHTLSLKRRRKTLLLSVSTCLNQPCRKLLNLRLTHPPFSPTTRWIQRGKRKWNSISKRCRRSMPRLKRRWKDPTRPILQQSRQKWILAGKSNF